jgi:hypothetical protein
MSEQPPGYGSPPPPPAEPQAETPIVDSPPPPPAAYTPQPSYPPPVESHPPPPQYGTPPAGQVPPPIVPMAPASSGGVNLMYQFSGVAGWSVLLGVASIAVPFLFNRVFFFLPLIGLIAGVRAVMRARMIGGITGIVLNVVGGLITILALVAG